MEGYLVESFADREYILEKAEFRHFRIEVFNIVNKYDVSELFFQHYSHRIRDFPKLERCDVLVDDGLRTWEQFTEHAGGPKIHVRIVDAKTGEWFDEESEGPYMDYIDNSYNLEHGLEGISYTRIDDDWDEESEEDVKGRYDAMIKMKEEGLPRINLDY
jgi:hypothetical protein